MAKSEMQRWLEDFLTRARLRAPTSHKRKASQSKASDKDKNFPKRGARANLSQENRRRARIEKHGLCKTCKVRAISSGDTEIPEAARNEDRCLKCYIASRRRKPGRPRELDRSKPICIRCRSSNVTSGKCETAQYARRSSLCIRCYCSGKRGGDS